MTIQIIHPAAKPVQKGRNLLNASAQMNEGTATMGCNNQRCKQKLSEKQTHAQQVIKNINIVNQILKTNASSHIDNIS